MTVVGVLGDTSTTTALALASAWPEPAHDVVLVEFDPSGGSLAAWLGLPPRPSLSSFVAATRHGSNARSSGAPLLRADSIDSLAIDSLLMRTPGGLRVLPCPPLRREARMAVRESDQLLLRFLHHTVGRSADANATPAPIVFLDLGDEDSFTQSTAIDQVDLLLVVHRQGPASARAAAVRIERFAEPIESVTARRRPPGPTATMVGLVGDRPFPTEEVFLAVGAPPPNRVGASARSGRGTSRLVGAVGFPEDPVAAAVLAGRPAMSARRLRRQPLLRAAQQAARTIADITSTSGITTTPGAPPESVDEPARSSVPPLDASS